MDKAYIRKLAGLPLLESKERSAVDKAIAMIKDASDLLDMYEEELSKKKVNFDHHDDFDHIQSSLGKVIDDLMALQG